MKICWPVRKTRARYPADLGNLSAFEGSYLLRDLHHHHVVGGGEQHHDSELPLQVVQRPLHGTANPSYQTGCTPKNEKKKIAWSNERNVCMYICLYFCISVYVCMYVVNYVFIYVALRVY